MEGEEESFRSVLFSLMEYNPRSVGLEKMKKTCQPEVEGFTSPKKRVCVCEGVSQERSGWDICSMCLAKKTPGLEREGRKE